jgi:hypothetical protein
VEACETPTGDLLRMLQQPNPDSQMNVVLRTADIRIRRNSLIRPGKTGQNSEK